MAVKMLKSTDIVAYATSSGVILCPGCAGPKALTAEGYWPVFAGDEFDSYPACDCCHAKIDEVTLTEDGRAYEGVSSR